MLRERIKGLKGEMVSYAIFVQGMIEKSVKGLLTKQKELLKEVIEKDEPFANEEEIKIEEMCITTIAKFEPKAKLLREVLMVLKINNDLERIGDHAVNIADSGLYLIERPKVKPYIDLPRMSDEAIGMLKDSIDAFINEDAKLAKDVCERDDIVDNLRNQISRELITYMLQDPTTIERALHIVKISQNLERTADLATNIAEDVIFMVEGKIIKHHKEEEI